MENLNEVPVEQNVSPIMDITDDRNNGNGNGTEDYASSTPQSTQTKTNEVSGAIEIKKSTTDPVIDFLSKRFTNPQEQLEAGLKLLRTIASKDQDLSEKMDMSLASSAIRTGKVLIKLKKIVKLDKAQKWENWSAEKINFIATRTRQTYMQIARCKNIEKYTAIGKERLLHLSKITKDWEDDDDPIGSFLMMYTDYDSQRSIPVKELKIMVDAALFVNKARKQEIALDYLQVKEAIESGLTFGTIDLDNLKRTKNADRDPHDYLTHLQKTGATKTGWFSAEKDKERINRKQEKHLEYFNANPEVFKESIDKLNEQQQEETE
jgi:hypothetical protein